MAVEPRPARRRRLSLALAAFASDRAAVVSLVFLAIIALAALFAPWISPHDPYEADNFLRNAPPGSGEFLLGSDSSGRDILSRMIYGGRISLAVGFVPTFAAMVISLVLGLSAGYLGRWPDQLIMRTLDVLFAFPLVLLAIAIAGILNPGVGTEMIAIMVVLVPYITRIVRTSTLTVKAQPYVEAARAGGARGLTVVLRYVLPNMISPVLVYTTTLVGLMIVVGSGLSFLGLGVQAPAADWGTMVSNGRVVLTKAPHVTVFPGLLIVLVSLAFNFVGDGLRDALDPRAIRR
jgi:ABC-type dipeptide/oligopeptide/nickel transport system permease subunit